MTLADIEKDDPDDYQEMMLRGRYLAQSPEARGLPGYIGPH